KDQVQIDQLIVSGGGGRNKAVLLSLQQYFGENVRVMLIDELGFSSDAKEAVCFAVLANELISGNTANLPSVTGAEKSTLLGKICFP
ncbi:MAG: anhydro-N-acetylmuramic acid kinase, partial [Syntrophothermus sp.]